MSWREAMIFHALYRYNVDQFTSILKLVISIA